MTKNHLKGLDSLRAIAALIVIFTHIELIKGANGISNLFKLPFYTATGGHTAVVLFFVLSGFLITTLLIKEQNKFNSISIKKFYLRRIFRVWPLYYLTLIVSAFVLGFTPSTFSLILCLSIFPNLAHALGYGWSASPQIWSIGVEEQFYLMWPFLVKYFHKKLLKVLILFVIFFSLLPHFLLFVIVRVYPDKEIMKFINDLFFGTKFQCMAIGGIFATIIQNYPKYIKYISNKLIAVFMIIITFALWFYGFYFRYFNDEFYAILFGLLLVNLSLDELKINVDIQPLKFLGKISYGLYMYHWMIIVLITKYMVSFFKTHNSVLSNIVLYFSVFSSIIIVSSLSYYIFEKKLLDIKDKFNRQ